MDFTTLTSFGGCMTLAGQNVSAPIGAHPGAVLTGTLQAPCQPPIGPSGPQSAPGAEQGAGSSAPASGTFGAPRFAQAPLGHFAPLLNMPVGGSRLDPVQGKVPYRGRPAANAAVWYGVVGEDGVARALRATYEGKAGTSGQGRWLDAGGVALPGGVLLFDSAPACRGWMVAHMGATAKGYIEHGEPLGVTP